jgi:hypothetical protein
MTAAFERSAPSDDLRAVAESLSTRLADAGLSADEAALLASLLGDDDEVQAFSYAVPLDRNAWLAKITPHLPVPTIQVPRGDFAGTILEGSNI